MMNKFVHYMHFSSSYYLQVIIFIRVIFYLFFHLDVIHRLLFRFPCSVFTGSLFRFPCYLQAPFLNLHVIYRLLLFDLHVIYRLPFSISMLLTGSIFDFHVFLRLPSIYMKFTGSLFRFT